VERVGEHAAIMKFNKGKSGVTLVETMIGLGILGLIVVIASSSIATMMRQFKVENAKSLMRDMAERVRLDLANPENMWASASQDFSPGNSNLKICVTNNASPLCVMSDEQGKQMEFNLKRRLPDGTVEDVSGSYDIKGRPCQGANNTKCVFHVKTYFWATCPLTAGTSVPQSQCDISDAINTRYIVYATPNVGSSAGNYYAGLTNYSFPPKNKFDSDKLSFATRMSTASIVQRASQEKCGAGKVQLGYDPKGLPICRCIGHENVNVSPNAICPGKSCGANQFAIGFNSDGSLNCEDISQCNADSKTCDCQTVTFNTASSGKCPNGYWMRSIDFGQCYATSSKEKGVETVECERNTAVCCSLGIF
jgi:Tfp pilus assembly protein PilE